MASPASPSRALEVWAIGTTPPPVTGMTLLTEQVVQGLRRVGPFTFLNWSPGIQRRGLQFRLRRMARVIGSMYRLIAHGRVGNSRLYLTANSSRSGLLLTGIVVSVAMHLGHRVYLHHHSYAYIDRYDWRMAWIDRTMGSHGVHVVHAQQMIDDMRARYRSRCGFEVVYPSVVAIELGRARDSAGTPFCLGHLSNLMPAKGLDVVLQTFQALHDQGCDVCLRLAGPFHTPVARKMVQQAMDRYGSLVKYDGPLYGPAKQGFFNEIDAFLFPSRNESWGIVLHEAMAAGAPVITNDRGCVRTAVGDKAGLVVGRDQDFLSVAVPQIRRWMEDGDEYRQASRAAIEQATFLHQEGERTLIHFVEQLFASPEAGNSLAHQPA